MPKFLIAAAGLLLAAALALIFLTGGIPGQDLNLGGTPQSTPPASTAETAQGILSAFQATDLEGEAVDESILAEAKLTMVNVWATYCPSCIDCLPDLAVLQETYAEAGLKVMGIISDTVDPNLQPLPEQLETARKLLEDSSASYLQLIPSADLVYLVLYQIQYIPTTFFVDSQGRQVGTAFVGARELEDWQEIVEEYLAEVAS